MIYVQLNREGFEYDIHSLVKAFFPPENVSIYTEADHGGADRDRQTEPESLRMEIDWGDEYADIRLFSPGVSPQPVGTARFPVSDADRRTIKNRLKQRIYELLSEYTGKTLPWGTLTGVRPTKLVMTMLEEGMEEAQIRSYMADTYYTSPGKIDLGIAIAKRELGLLRRMDIADSYSLYVGIPFCPSTCLYCSFTSYPLSAWQKRVDDYLEALEREIDCMAQHMRDRHLNTVYIGGGTPTTLSPEQLERLIRRIREAFGIKQMPGVSYLEPGSVLEFTVEAGRPDSITPEKLAVLREQGVSRISINPQTMKQETLDLLGRHHTVQQTIDSFHLARQMGFHNINMDLIMGLPQETLSDAEHTLTVLRELAPDNITVHSLAIKRAARLNLYKEEYADLMIHNTQRHLDMAASVCAGMGMQPYYLYRQKNMAGNFENVGYARPGREGLYNILIMEEVQNIVALGAGSISKRVYPDGNIKRCENVKDVAQYIDRIEEMIERKRLLFGD